VSLRGGFYFAALLAVAIGLSLLRLWQPEQQVRKHSDHLLKAVADKNWTRFEAFLAEDYHDQWDNDRTVVLERTREVFRYLRGIHLHAIAPSIRLEPATGYWQSVIRIDGDENELMNELKTRVNTLETPFELTWRRKSSKPWDWQLVAVRNPGLSLPSDY